MKYFYKYLELRTTFNIDSPAEKIAFDDPVMFLGSCFANSIGTKMERARMAVCINPSGAVYNPVSVSQSLNNIISGREFIPEDLYYSDGEWISFSHYTDFSSIDQVGLLSKINKRTKEASEFLNKTRFLFITLGTARIFRLAETGEIVSNCHKVPASMFQREIMRVEEITEIWSAQLDKLENLYPHLRVIFTISPVRHWKDGAHGNQISKAVLLLAVEEILKHHSKPHYFPAYELLMDDLRDYRFYADDMLHPSQSAIDYIWDAFSACYLDNNTTLLINEVTKITSACLHRFNTESPSKRIKFAETMIEKIEVIRKKIPSVDFSEELKYFNGLLIK